MILVIKHVPQEGPGSIAEFFKEVKTIELHRGDLLPSDVSGIDAVFIMGGPMNVYEEDKYPFLKDEDRFIKLLVREGIPTIGICLGAQLLAKACGAKVYKAPLKEIGWCAVELTEDGLKDSLFDEVPARFKVLQWHEDTFDIPEHGVLLAVGENCRNQAFRVGTCAYGFQFHIEVTPKMIIDWFGNDSNEYEIYDEAKLTNLANRIYENFLDISAQNLGSPDNESNHVDTNMSGVYRKVIDSVEKKLIESVLEKTEGNQLHAAEILGINRNTLRAKIRKYGISALNMKRF